MIDLLIPREVAYLRGLTPRGTLRLSEGLTLAWLASKCKKPILEIGARQGKSTCFLASGSRWGNRAKVYTIDPWDWWGDPSQKTMAEDKDRFYEQTQPYHTTITAIQGFSLDVVKTWDKELGMVFIDGDHTMAREDYEAWSPFLAKKGVIAFHDAIPKYPLIQEAIKGVTQVQKWHVVYRLHWGYHGT